MTPYFSAPGFDLYCGDSQFVLREVPDESIHCCVTSPPYLYQRDYGCEGQIGLESTVEAYIAALVGVFSEVKRVLRKDGTLWVNIGDSYASGKGTCRNPGGGPKSTFGTIGKRKDAGAYPLDRGSVRDLRAQGLKPKDLCMVPARLALALQVNGWHLRARIIWAKQNGRPESAQDRPTNMTEDILLLSKSARPYYDAYAVRERLSAASIKEMEEGYEGLPLKDYDNEGVQDTSEVKRRVIKSMRMGDGTRNMWNYWLFSTEAFVDRYCSGCDTYYAGEAARRIPRKREASPTGRFQGHEPPTLFICPTCGRTDAWVSHYAVFPQEIPRRAILAGTSAKGACAACGVPYRRITRAKDGGKDYDGPISAVKAGIGATSLFETGEWQTRVHAGWEPGCKCDCPDLIPCTVLDCFAGTGTAGIVAHSLGRRFAGIELNPDYVKMSAKRFELMLQQGAMTMEVA